MFNIGLIGVFFLSIVPFKVTSEIIQLSCIPQKEVNIWKLLTIVFVSKIIIIKEKGKPKNDSWSEENFGTTSLWSHDCLPVVRYAANGLCCLFECLGWRMNKPLRHSSLISLHRRRKSSRWENEGNILFIFS